MPEMETCRAKESNYAYPGRAIDAEVSGSRAIRYEIQVLDFASASCHAVILFAHSSHSVRPGVNG